ncbi:transcriptional regulator [Shewanella sairae]|uniref:Transcriptional regulator n=1 Tax=Shewanella sairae TaxID=190310 RepID=A0ABQ4PR83_9GAMM|nr:type II toxin-antitoxin system MqsA family antitoxin [Shewanella sairae]MCL1132277.1 type II toxin-antitoxin system MqsA family antitoxin [Shewanella sairae]GIU51997.1 transcriptional regulator [Shewanella sairae]
MNNRDLFSELSVALIEAKEHSEGMLTLKHHRFNDISELNISPDEIVSIRERFNMSRGVFARLLHTSSRTLENWEQGRSTPNGQAVTLLKLVQRHPQTLSQIVEL